MAKQTKAFTFHMQPIVFNSTRLDAHVVGCFPFPPPFFPCFLSFSLLSPFVSVAKIHLLCFQGLSDLQKHCRLPLYGATTLNKTLASTAHHSFILALKTRILSNHLHSIGSHKENFTLISVAAWRGSSSWHVDILLSIFYD